MERSNGCSELVCNGDWRIPTLVMARWSVNSLRTASEIDLIESVLRLGPVVRGEHYSLGMFSFQATWSPNGSNLVLEGLNSDYLAKLPSELLALIYVDPPCNTGRSIS